MPPGVSVMSHYKSFEVTSHTSRWTRPLVMSEEAVFQNGV